MYFRNSHARRLLPMPAGPMTDTRRARRLATGGVEQVLEQAQLVVAADERRLERPRCGCARHAPRRRAARARPATGAVLPLSICSPAALERDGAAAARIVASPTRTVPGGATDWSRLAVLTMSPATMPWPIAPRVTAASPVSTPARAWIAGPSAADGVDEVERGADGALGVVLVGDRRAPDGHHGVADELLDRAAVALDDLARQVEVARQELAHVLGSRSSAKGVKPTRSANRTVTSRRSATGADVANAAGSEGRDGAPSEPAWSPLNRCRNSTTELGSGPESAAPQVGQPEASAVPHSRQNFRPGLLAAPQFAQVTPFFLPASRLRVSDATVRFIGNSPGGYPPPKGSSEPGGWAAARQTTMKIADGTLGAIGDTPVVRLRHLVTERTAEIVVKLEAANPTGSYKDRMALAMIEGAERRAGCAGPDRRRVHRRQHRLVAGARLRGQGLSAADRLVGRVRRREDPDDAGVRRRCRADPQSEGITPT